jgi:mycofactocin system glycosyltransferase
VTLDPVTLPAGMRLAIDPSVRRVDGGRVLIGGSPVRILRLTAAGAGLVDRLAAGEPVGESRAAQRLVRRLLDGGLAHPVWRDGAGRLSFTAADVTVVIPVYARPEGLRATLASLAADPDGPTQVIVVDDGSPDAESVARVAADAGATLVLLAVNGGPAAARNRGLAEVTTPLVAFVDTEVELPIGWHVPLLAHFADPSVVAVAPRVRPESPTRVEKAGVIQRYEQDRSPLDLGRAEARVSPRTRVAYVPTAMLVARVGAVRRVGGFDEDLRFGEDVDLTWRLLEAGQRVRYEPGLIVTHPVRPDFGAWLRQRYSYGRSAAPLARRHPGALAPVSVSAWSASSWLLAAGGLPAVGVGVGAVAALQLPGRLQGLDHPWAEGLRLAGSGTWSAWRPLSTAVTRTWWPAALGASLVSKRARRAVFAAVVIPPLVDWCQGERSLDPARYFALRIADDLAYGAGVWAGCVGERTAEALRPDLHSWPGRKPAVEE